MVFRWQEHTIWFVVGVDLLYALAFITFLQNGQSELEKKKDALTDKCQRQKEADAAALAEEEKDYIERIGQEYQYFEFVNTIRLLSRELFTKVNPNAYNAAHLIDSLLQEVRDKLFSFNETFCSRFLNEEIRNADFYEEGSALRHLATVKELFASHILLLWMAVKHTSGPLKNKVRQDEDTRNKLDFIRNQIASLIHNKPFLEQIRGITAKVAEESRNGSEDYSVGVLARTLDGFDSDTKPADDTSRLAQLQKLYLVIHKYFMGKAGNYEIPYEIAQDSLDFLFSEEVKKEEAAQGIIKQEENLVDEWNTTMKAATPLMGHLKKDFIAKVVGEHRDDQMMNFNTEESKAEINEEEENPLEDGDEFAYLKEELLFSSGRQHEWRQENLGTTAPPYL
jgi:hypothetical protein